MEILVVGGGVVGLSAALDLLLGGYRVRVLVRDEREGASWVAGGMLAPFSEGLEGDFLSFSVESLRLWEEFLTRLWDLTGRRVFYSEGILRLALSEKEVRELKEKVKKYSQGLCSTITSYEASELKKEFPYLSDEVVYGVLFGDEGNVDTEELMESLYRAVEVLGGEVIREDVLKVKREGEKVEWIQGFGGKYGADFFVFASGAWLKEHFDFPVFPVKGQILRVDASLRDYVLYSSASYIIPREKDLLIGATTEKVGFNRSTTLNGVGSLINGALRVVPSLGESTLLEVKVGFRPGTPDEKPILYYGENFAVLGGNYRNGILHAPLMGRILLNLVDRGEVSEYFQKFSPYRFLRDS
ncbi:MAG: glycine oxidase ThiO [Aquificae bacterium]|nr:glycine oxidase ThiO [Aquificota bacterium]